MNKSDTFCIAPWVMMHLMPNGDIYPCCVANRIQPLGNLSNNTFEEVFNSRQTKKLRYDLMNGRKNRMCRECYEREKIYNESHRTWENERWQHKIDVVDTTKSDGYLPEFSLSYVDFRFSNKCNMKCVMCGYDNSSAWKQDSIEIFSLSPNEKAVVKPDISTDKFIEQFDSIIPSLEEIAFAGGEPLIMDEHYMMLDRLIEEGKTWVRLRYNTNLSILNYKGRSIVDLWEKFDTVIVAASLDGIGERGEYIRKGLNYNKFIDNILCIKNDCKHVQLEIHCAVQLLNIYHIPEMHRELYDLGIVTDSFDIHFTPLVSPTYLRYELINETMYVKLTSMYAEYYEFLSKTGMDQLDTMHTIISGYKYIDKKTEFIEFITSLDKVRNTDYLNVCPELKDL